MILKPKAKDYVFLRSEDAFIQVTSARNPLFGSASICVIWIPIERHDVDAGRLTLWSERESIKSMSEAERVATREMLSALKSMIAG